MKKSIKNLLVSVLSAAMFLFCGAATTLLTVSADETIATETSGFTMVDGASIRLANPKGLRFIAEMGSQEYKALLTSEDGIEKKMGMFIMPYSYLSDPSKYVNGETDITEKNYENITKKLDFVFYNSGDESVQNAIYAKDGYYRANGVIGDLYLHNYDTEFVGIAYIAETNAEGTNYTFADFNEKDNVRSAAYVASEAYADYSVQEVRDCFDEYICGGILENAGMAKNEDSTYTYKGTTYDSILAAATGAELNKESARVMANNSITSYGFKKIGEDSSVTLNASTHNGEYATRQPMGGEVEDMSYVEFKGNYGLNDWVVFDFTGDNMPFVSFFNSEVTNTIYNQEYNGEEFSNKAYTGVSGWVIGNGIRTPNGSILGGVDYAPQNRLTLIGPNKITALYDNNTIQNVANVQTRSVISDFALSIKALQDSTDSYRVFMGFVEGADSSKMNLVVHAINLATGAVVVSDQSLSVAKCSVEGSIALHGQFGKTTKLDKIHPIMEDMTLDAVKQALPTDIELYNATLTDGRLVLNASTHKGAADNIPLNNGYQEDMSYIALNGKYGLNDYLVFEFKGDNMPFISFFNNTVTNTMWNWAQDTSINGWVIANGIKSPSGKNFNGGGQTAEACRLMFYGPNKMTSYDGNAGQWRELIAGSKADPSPISTYALAALENPDTYRAIVGVADAGNGNVTLQIYVMDAKTDAVIANYAKTYAASAKTYSEGSIILYGQFDHATEVERLYPVEEDTTLENLIEKYQSKIVHNATIYEDGSVQFEASTHKGSADNIPQNSGYQEDMSYIAFNGKYGLNDYLVFDFTGDNMPFISFFNNTVTNTMWNWAQDTSISGWVIANGIKSPSGKNFNGGGQTTEACRLMFYGPNKMTSYDGNAGQWRELIAGSKADPSPISTYVLSSQEHYEGYRAIIGVADVGNGNVTLQIYVVNKVSGEVVADYAKTYAASAKTYSEGSIVLYGQFDHGTKIDKLYPIEEDATLEALIAKYKPIQYNATVYNDSAVSLAASTHNGEYATRQPMGGEVEDMSYVGFKGNYGLNDWVVFDFTGDNMPFVSFFNSEVTNTIYNQEYTAEEFSNKAYTSVSGWVIGNGIRTPNGSILGGVDYSAQNRLTLIGPNKITALYDGNTIQNVANVQTRSVISDFALSIKALQDSTDSYRVFMGFVEGADSSKMNLVVHAINLATGAVVVSDQSLSVTKCSVEGSIALYGQFGKETVLDKLYPIEEDTTLDALLAKYAYSEKQEESLSFENYAYAGPTNGQWYLDGEAQVADGDLVDFRTYEGLKAYKDAGFSIYCPQDSLLITDGTTYSDIKEVLDRAHNLGLKVVLMDNRIIQLSRPITITDDTTVNGTAWTVGDGGKFATLDELDATLKGYISLYKNHPAFYGVMLGDEPSHQNAECYGMVYQSLKRIMPEIYVQYNLLPLENSFSVVKYRYPGLESSWSWNADIEGAYKNYLSKFYEAMGADYIQIDDYAMRADGIDATYLCGLQIIAEFAKEKDIAVKIIAQTCAMKSNGELALRGISEADARWINNTLLGFGVKQINYFTYFTKVSNSTSGELFVDGESFVNHDGTKTDLYYFMQEIMAENQAFAPTILNFDYQGSKIYSNTYAFDSSHVTDVKSDSAFTHISNVTTSTDATLVTELCNDSNEYMYMLMNTIDPSKTGATTQTVTITFNGATTATVYKNGVAEKIALTNNAYTVTLNAGDAVYIVLN